MESFYMTSLQFILAHPNSTFLRHQTATVGRLASSGKCEERNCPPLNFDEEVFRRQTYAELPWSSCELRAGVDEAQDLRSSPAPFLSCYPVFQAYDLDSDGTMDTLSHLDVVTSSGSLDRKVLEIDRFGNCAPPLGHSAPLAAENCIESACHAGVILRLIKLFSASGTQHKYHTSISNGTELKDSSSLDKEDMKKQGAHKKLGRHSDLICPRHPDL